MEWLRLGDAWVRVADVDSVSIREEE